MSFAAIRELDSYSDAELKAASSDSPAIKRYLGILQSRPLDFSGRIRISRHRAWLEVALASYFDSSSVQTVCHHWSLSAESLIESVWNEVGLSTSRLALFALGKLGARELNLSSDVDLMIVGNSMDPMSDTRKIKEFKRLLETPTSFGFALRADFDLRPDGNWGPLIVSIPSFQDHYWSRGETWERLALIRMRDLIGNQETIEETHDLRQRFCFRKFTDFTLHEDLKQLRPRIHSVKPPSTGTEVDLKLSVGGIRDIELYVHSLQVIYGGRLPELRVHGTSEAIGILSRNFPDKASKLSWLDSMYWNLRNLENKVQLRDDGHTHSISRSFHYPNLTDAAWSQLQKEMARVDSTVSSLVGDVGLASHSLPNSEEAQNTWLLDLGFAQEVIREVWPRIIKATALSHKRDRDEVIRRELLFRFVTMVSDAEPLKAKLALEHFLDFVKSARAKATLFALLLREDKLLKLIVKLFTSSNYMSQLIIARPELLDGLVYGHQEMASSLEESLEILIERRQISEIRSALLFQEIMDPSIVSRHLTSTADQIALDLKQIVKQEIAGSDFSVFALGKWGTFELGFHSDLDFIMVKNGAIYSEDHKAAKRFISFLRSPQRGGKIYDVDLRLRPSGGSGPLLVSLEQFLEYTGTKAQAWERQSYLKLRPLDSSLKPNLSAMFKRGLDHADRTELISIRQKLLRPQQEDTLDIKYNPGGMLDLELCAQAAILANKVEHMGSTNELVGHLAESLDKWRLQRERYRSNYARLRQLEQSYRLTSQTSELRLQKNKSNFHETAFLLQIDPDDLWAEIEALLEENRSLVKKLDPVYSDQ